MDKQHRDELKIAYKKEKEPRILQRMLAVNMVCVREKTIQDTAESLMQCPDWVSKWVQRYQTGGIENLRDSSRSGRPSLVSNTILNKIMHKASKSPITPVKLQKNIHEKTGVMYHITHIRKILHKFLLSPKQPTRIHINAADKSEVARWKHNLKARIPCLKSNKYTLVMTDESFFVRDKVRGRKQWTPVRVPVIVPYVGNHDTITAYGALTEDGRQLFRLYDKFNSVTFVEYLKELHHYLGKIVVILDGASVHHSKKVKNYIQHNKDVKLIYLPKGSPYLNPVEECWRRAKQEIMVSRYYPSKKVLKDTLSNYFRTIRFNLDMWKYLKRQMIEIPMNL